ncbi:MAG: cytochrome c-type biogenesis protein CcmH [Sulfitobacter sp.]|nr:cytochrome c-type biogenesis protein CcmH [Sulfitobacter sp.]
MKRLLVILLLLASPLAAVQPDEVLENPVLEQRARDLSKGLRCLVCRNESIDESNASLARDLRLLLRERLVAGDTDAEAMSFIVDRYGEYVLLRPDVRGANWLLWGAGPLMLLLAGGVGFAYLRRRQSAAAPTEAPLSADEQARLDEILRR